MLKRTQSHVNKIVITCITEYLIWNTSTSVLGISTVCSTCGYENDTAFGVKSLQAESKCPFRQTLQQLAEDYYKKKNFNGVC